MYILFKGMVEAWMGLYKSNHNTSKKKINIKLEIIIIKD